MNKTLVYLVRALILINFLLFITGCVTEAKDTPKDSILETAVKDETTLVQDNTDTQTSIEEAKTDVSDDSLKGTCPRGGHCGSPGCGLWSDQNNDRLCDRVA
ncbi:MAG: hypothetical protein WAX07_01105 [Candidatus Altiarchaeia archaeon]